jgi:hypothetical protein
MSKTPPEAPVITCSHCGEDIQLPKRTTGVIYARDGREARFTTDELLATYSYRYKGSAQEAIRAIIRTLIESLVPLDRAGID